MSGLNSINLFPIQYNNEKKNEVQKWKSSQQQHSAEFYTQHVVVMTSTNHALLIHRVLLFLFKCDLKMPCITAHLSRKVHKESNMMRNTCGSDNMNHTEYS